MMLGLEIADPDALNVLDVFCGEIGLARPLLHFSDPDGGTLHLIGRERLELLMTRHDLVTSTT